MASSATQIYSLRSFISPYNTLMILDIIPFYVHLDNRIMYPYLRMCMCNNVGIFFHTLDATASRDRSITRLLLVTNIMATKNKVLAQCMKKNLAYRAVFKL